jgi:hypothetical protein
VFGDFGGDGVYPVYATYDASGLLLSVTIQFNPDPDEDDPDELACTCRGISSPEVPGPHHDEICPLHEPL